MGKTSIEWVKGPDGSDGMSWNALRAVRKNGGQSAHHCEHVKIGVVAEDGRQYYAETTHANMVASTTEWLRENVAPHLRGPHVERKQIGHDLIAFMGEKPEIWAYCADYDWVALCQLFGTMMELPKGWPKYCRDVKQLADSLGNPPLPPQISQEHHALDDAVWTMDAWQFLQGDAIARLPTHKDF